ncbi:MAG: ATP phosphoribosyltransferase regulatory subunit [Candidatus Nitrospira kreftii]|uniref:ATP phosphoribosyltransferase regulatory subunit n=1 Tax=Candidatus Nitrospira kreftii TaxID=2652173 RepID=A0A7S8FDY9_9BACT|nr:MAG: ATP phosphoribosyltransferase regulatory subunit [Candidatus Nitrospira kreftii]
MASAPPTRRLSSGELAPSDEHSLVPVGMATILPEAARHVRQLESELLTCFYRYGYDEIILPTFEYFDVLAPGLEPALLENSYKIVDRTTGRILLLRPDVTAQIARTVAMGMLGTRLPLRLSYRATVFRYEPDHVGRDRELFQVGAELIGADDLSADCEIIMLMIESLRQVGLPSFKISLGHVGFFKGLLVRAGLSAEGQKLAEQAASRKDFPWLREILERERVGKRSAQSILNALELCGKAEVLSKGRALARGEQPLVQALDRLAQVYELLCSMGFQDLLLLDLGEFRGFDYYDGIVFDVFTDGIGIELGGGGRYDHLIGRFGRDIPSTGFALNVDRLFRGLNLVDTTLTVTSAVLVVGPVTMTKELVSVSRQLRQVGVRVIQQAVTASGQDLVGAAADAGLEADIPTTIVMGADQPNREHVVVLSRQRMGDGKAGRSPLHKKTMSISDFMASLRTDREGTS